MLQYRVLTVYQNNLPDDFSNTQKLLVSPDLQKQGGEGTRLTEEYELEQNYPNPFNPMTEIKYSLPEAGFVIITVYDVLGNVIAEIVNENKDAGTYSAAFDASELASGLYLYSIRVNGFYQTKKMLLVR